MLRFALLGLLKYGPQTGYELKQAMDQSTGNFWHAKQSQIYTTLKKLDQAELVCSHPEPQERRPDRRVYKITELGDKELLDWLSQPVTKLEKTKQLLLLKLFFSGKLDKEVLLTQLRLIRKLHEQKVESYKTETPNLINEITNLHPGLTPDSYLWDATRRFGQAYGEMYICWLDETISMVEKNF